MASKFCFNPDCNVSISHDFKNGWRLRNFAFANLCHRCGSIYEEGRFCEVFHKYATGWRCCETCGKRVHCGCIVSIHAFVFLDAGGIECMICARKNVPLTPNQMCPPQSLPNWLMQSPVRNWSQTPRSASNKLWHQGENFFNKPCTYLKLGSRTSFEVDMSTEFERLFLSDRIAALPPKRNQTQNFSFSNGRLKHNGPENPGYERTVVNCDKEACHQHPVHQCFLKDGQWKLLTASLHNVDSSCQSQICEFKTVEARVRKELLARYQPKTSDEELQQISGSPHSIIIPMFEKTLSTSDANRIGRMVLPKVYAEAYFPPISQSEGLPLKFEDINGKEWTFQFRYWINNNSRMYVLEGVSNCIQSLQLQAGDTVSFGRTEPQGKLILGFRKASSGLLSQGTLAGKSGNEMHIGVDGNQKPKFKEDPTKCHSKVNRATGGSSSIPFERKNSTLNAKRKRSKVDNMGLLGLKLTLEEAQRLLRSPPNHDPHVVIIEDFEFEEFEDAPVIGRPTIIVRGSLGEAIQWAQCDNCMKWRKLPFDYLLPAKWTCTENVWDPERSSCDAAQELSVKQLRDLLSIHNPVKKSVGAAASKKLKGAELDAHASEDVEALYNFVMEGYENTPASTQLTTKHPRHRLGCSCIVCSQPPSGGPKHQQNCTCKFCMMVKRRFQTIMIRHEKNQSEKESVIRECMPQRNTHSSKQSNSAVKLLESNSQACVTADTNMIRNCLKDQIDLNTPPEREEEALTCCNSMALIGIMQDASESSACKLCCNINPNNVCHRNCDNNSDVEHPPVSVISAASVSG